MKKTIVKPTKEQIELLKRTGSPDKTEALNAMHALGQALQVPLRSGLLKGSIIDGIFVDDLLDPGATAEYPLDLYQASNADDYVAYMMPSEGAIPQRSVSSSSITVSTYPVANAIDWPIEYARTARWNIVARSMEVFEAGFIQKANTDGWRVLIAAAAGRTDYNSGAPLVYDSVAVAGQFTKRLVSLMKTTMSRLSGGNSATPNRGRLTDLYVSVEAIEDIREWDSDTVDETTRREIMVAEEEGGPLSRIYGVNLHPITELGVSQEFQTYFATLGLSMGTSDEEIVIGLDLSDNDSFAHPVKQELQVYEDDTLHRRGKAGFYGRLNHGFAVLDSRRCLLGSF